MKSLCSPLVIDLDLVVELVLILIVCEFLGYTAEDLINRELVDLVSGYNALEVSMKSRALALLKIPDRLLEIVTLHVDRDNRNLQKLSELSN